MQVAGEEWPAVVDTGFNGDVELSVQLQGKLNDQPVGRLKSSLAGGQVIEEEAYSVDFPFDGRSVQAIATYVSDSQILLGTNLMREHRLEIRFASKIMRLERE